VKAIRLFLKSYFYHFSLEFQVAFSKGFSDFSGFKSTSCATFGKSSDDLALRVAAQTAVVGATIPIYLTFNSSLFFRLNTNRLSNFGVQLYISVGNLSFFLCLTGSKLWTEEGNCRGKDQGGYQWLWTNWKEFHPLLAWEERLSFGNSCD
jgi:hypothetical protein